MRGPRGSQRRSGSRRAAPCRPRCRRAAGSRAAAPGASAPTSVRRTRTCRDGGRRAVPPNRTSSTWRRVRKRNAANSSRTRVSRDGETLLVEVSTRIGADTGCFPRYRVLQQHANGTPRGRAPAERFDCLELQPVRGETADSTVGARRVSRRVLAPGVARSGPTRGAPPLVRGQLVVSADRLTGVRPGRVLEARTIGAN